MTFLINRPQHSKLYSTWMDEVPSYETLGQAKNRNQNLCNRCIFILEFLGNNRWMKEGQIIHEILGHKPKPKPKPISMYFQMKEEQY